MALPSVRRVGVSAVVHYGALIAAVPVLLIIGRGQWFFYDEWAFLQPDNGGIWASHGGHWSTIPVVMTDALRATIGLEQYWPYYLLMLVAHVTLVHLLWRIMIRHGASGWVATGLAMLMLYLGAGSENLLWAFQFGFILGIALPVGGMLLLSRDRMTMGSSIAASVLVLAGLASSGTSIPVAIAGALVAVRRHGIKRALAIFVPPAIIYGIWFLAKGRGTENPFHASGIVDYLTGIPRFAAAMFTDGFGTVFPAASLGLIAAVGLMAWIVSHAREAAARETIVPYALVGAAIVFSAMSAYSRLQLGVGTASSSRYVYLVVALCLPVTAIALSRLVRERRSVLMTVSALVAALIVFNLGTLIGTARSEAVREQETRGKIYAGLVMLIENPSLATDERRPDTRWAPDITAKELLEMHKKGWIEVGHYSTAEKLGASTELMVTVTPDSSGTCTPLGADLAGVSPGTAVRLALPASTELTMTSIDGAQVGLARIQTLSPGEYAFNNSTKFELRVSSLPAGTQICNE